MYSALEQLLPALIFSVPFVPLFWWKFFESTALDDMVSKLAWHPSNVENLFGRRPRRPGSPDLKQVRFMAVPLWYHSGQLNFIQTLLGDDEWHW